MTPLTGESREKQRLNFDFAPERVEELRQLQAEAGGLSMKELVNNALTLLEWSIAETKRGNEIAAVNEADQTFRVLVMPVLQRVKRLQPRSEVSPHEQTHVSAS